MRIKTIERDNVNRTKPTHPVRSTLAKRLLLSLLALLALFQLPVAFAQVYPNKPVTIIVPFAAGGGTDLLARFWGAILQKELGQTFIIDVRAGAGGVIGTRMAALAPADGYTILIATPAFALNPYLIKNAGYELKDFQPIIITGLSGIAVVVPLESPIKNVRDLLEAARANPGGLSVGNAGVGSGGQLAAAAFQAHMNVKFTEIPYKGAAPALVDLIGGRTHAQFEAFPSVLSYIKSGKVRAIAVTPKRRSVLLPNIPTADESGAAGYEASSWTAFMVPAKTPRVLVDRLNAVFRKALADPDVLTRMADAFGSDPGGGTPDETLAYVTAKFKENEALTKAMGVVPQ